MDSPLFLKDVTKRYGSFTAVDAVSLTVDPGEVFGFLGPNGAGKTTVIRTILNFMRPSNGTITVFGLDSAHDSVNVKHRLGYLAGDIALYENMTGQQVLEHLSALGKQTDWTFVDELAKKLSAQLNKPIKSLSKGNKQKIGLIQAFMHKPDLLILDEPTSGLDPLMKQVFYDMVHDMKAAGKTVFVSSHDLSEVQKICDRAAFIREGKLIAIKDVHDADALSLRRYKITFAKNPPAKTLEKIEGVRNVRAEESIADITISGSVDPLIKALAKHEILGLDEEETTLEELFIGYYSGEKS